jgi:lactosylceramide 4-alpha-galactosyltransferase
MKIYFLMATNESKVEMEYTDLYKALSTYDNIKIRYMNIIDYAKKTPLEEFFAKDELGKSEFRIEHTSDILRGLTLYKYGGLYTDLDVLSFFPLRLLNESNFVCLERSDHFSSAIIRLDLKEGRRFSTTYVQ